MTRSIIKGPSGIKPGDVGPGFVCEKCGVPSPIANDIADLSDPFRAKCPKCGHVGQYQKSQIQTLVAHRKQ